MTPLILNLKMDAAGNVTGTATPVVTPPNPTPGPVPYADPATVLLVYQINAGPETGIPGNNCSLAVAQHYMTARGIPQANLVGVATHIDNCGGPGCPNGNYAHSDSTNIWGGSPGPASMAVFQQQVLAPIKAKLQALGGPSKIKYIVPVYGVPVTIAGSVAYGTLGVDSQLAAILLGQLGENITNPYYSAQPTSTPPHIDTSNANVLLVCRLDGPSAAQSAALVDKALAGETAGVKGTGYFDYNPSAPYGQTTLNAANLCRVLVPAQSVVLNNQQQTGHMIQSAPNTAWAWGGYDLGQANAGVYSFVDGSCATQMNSNSAATIRRPTTGAVVYTFLLNGVTCTWGCVNEPAPGSYAAGDNLLNHLWKGYTFGEASYIACPTLNWMFCFVGDPLYRPTLR